MQRSRGSIFIASLWMLIIAMLLLGAISYTVSGQLKLLGYYADDITLEGHIGGIVRKVQQALAADGEAYDTKYKLMTRIQSNSGPLYQENETCVSTCVVEDEQQRININTAPYDILIALPGMTVDRAAALIDWRDEDDIPHVGGAENAYYARLDKPYPCKNSRFESLDELLLVRGFDRAFVMSVEQFLTLYGSGAVNINTAPPEVLTILGMSKTLQEMISRYRAGLDGIWGTVDDHRFISTDSILPSLTAAHALMPSDLQRLNALVASGMIGVSTGYYRVLMTVKLPNNAGRAAEAVIDKKLGTVVSWKE